MQASRTVRMFCAVLTMFLLLSPDVWSFQGAFNHPSIIRKYKSGLIKVPSGLFYRTNEDVSVCTRLLATTSTSGIKSNDDDFENIGKSMSNRGKAKKVGAVLRGLEEYPHKASKKAKATVDATNNLQVTSIESKSRGRPRSGVSSKLRSALCIDALSGGEADDDDLVVVLGASKGKKLHLEKETGETILSQSIRPRGRPRSVSSGLASPSKGSKADGVVEEGEEDFGRAMPVLEPGEEDEYYFQGEDEEESEEEGFDLEDDDEPAAAEEGDGALPATAVGRRPRRSKLTFVGVDGLPIDREYSEEEKEWLPDIYLGGLPRQQQGVPASDADDCYQQVLDNHLYGHIQPAPWRVQVVSVVTNSSSNSTALECVEKIYAHIRQAFPADPRLDFQTLCLVEGDCEPFAELEGVVQMWLEGYNTHHLVDGAAMKEVWGGVVPHILLSEANLQAIVDTVEWALEESELQGTLLSPRMRNLRLRGGKPVVEGGFNTQVVESDFSTVKIR